MVVGDLGDLPAQAANVELRRMRRLVEDDIDIEVVEEELSFGCGATRHYEQGQR